MVKSRLNFKSVKIDTNFNKDGEIFNKLYVNFHEGENDYYRIGDFLRFAEKNILKAKYNFDFETVALTDISSHISYVELVKDDTKFGTRMYLSIHFDIGYDKQLKLENDDYFLLNMVYKIDNGKIIASTSQTQTNNVKK